MQKLSEQARGVLNDKKRIGIRDGWFGRMQGLFDGKRDSFLETHFFAVNGTTGNADFGLLYENPAEWVIMELEDLAGKASLIDNEDMFVPLCIEPSFYGVHFIDKILGAEVFFQDGQWYNHYLEREVGSLERPDLDRDETWKSAREAAFSFRDAEVRLPLFGLPTIGRALIYRPAVLLADEPTGNLDRRNSEEILALLKLSNKRYHQTVVLITHDEKIALEAGRIITIEDGRVLRDSKADGGKGRVQ